MIKLFSPVLFFALLCCSDGILAQVTIGEFLRSASDDPEMKTFDEQIAYLQKKPYALSPLQRLEFRTQNRELIPEQQEFGIRVSPANPWEMRSNNRYFREFQSSLSLEKEMLFRQVLFDRYNLVIAYLYTTELRTLVEAREKLMATQLEVLEKQIGSSYFDADDYVDLKIDHLTESVEREEIDAEVADYIYRVERLYPNAFRKTLAWNYQEIISVEKAGALVDSIAAAQARSLLLDYQKQKIRLAQSEYKLEKSNINVGFLQTSYDNRRVEQDRNPISLSLGVTIPITNPNKGDMTRRKLEEIEAQYDLKESEHELQTDKMMLQDKMDRLTKQYKNLQQKIDALTDGNLSRTLTTLKNEDPLVNIQFNQNLIKLKVLAAKLKRNILFTYIEYLNRADRLQARPLTNYLSTNLEFIEN